MILVNHIQHTNLEYKFGIFNPSDLLIDHSLALTWYVYLISKIEFALAMVKNSFIFAAP